ncbi:BGTF surface domain-containing protein [Natrialba aegyptia]|uniref:BGTF surface domain-containing protein n=1 Tax=Natrialba aegyptia TaxID=129789 RepID=UPI00403AE3F7
MYEKGRAAFLAVLMVLSVVAMTASFAGAAAAVEDPGDSTLTVTVTDGDGNVLSGADVAIERSNDAAVNATNTTNDSGQVTFAVNNDTQYDLTVNADGYQEGTDTVTPSGDTETSVALTANTQTYDLTVNVAGLADGDSASVTVDGTEETGVTDSATFTGLEAGEYTIDAEADGYNPVSNTVNVSSNTEETVEFTEEGEFPLGVSELTHSDRLFQGELGVVDVTDANADTIDLEEVVDSSEDETSWERELTVYSLSEAADAYDDLEVAALETEIGAGAEVVVIETDNLDESSYQLAELESNGETFEFDIRVQELTSEFDDSTVTTIEGDSSETSLEIDSARADFQAVVSASGLEAEDLENIFGEEGENGVLDVNSEDDEITLDARGTFDASFSSIDAGEYQFDVEAADTTAADNATVNVSDDDMNVDLVTSDIVVGQGDLAELTIDLENTDTAYIQIGDEGESGFESLAQITDNSDDGYDEINVTYNTFVGGQEGVDESDAWNHDYDDLEIKSLNTTGGNLTQPLAATDYEISVGVSGNEVDGVTDETDTGFLTLNEYDGPSDVTTYTAPADADLGDLDDLNETTLTETDEIANLDQVIVAVEDYGLSGAIAGGTLEENTNLILSEEEAPNRNINEWNIGEGELETSYLGSGDDVEYDGTLYLVVDGVSDAYDEDDLDAGFDVSADADDSAFYLEEDEELSHESSFTVSERNIEWDDTAEEAPAVDGAELSGESNIAPGTELNTRARSSGNFTQSPEALIEDDGTFTASYDFSEYEPETEFTLRATDPVGSAEHVIDSVLFDAEEANVQLETDAPSEVAVGEDATLDVTVSNTGGSASDEIEVGVVIGGENELNENITLDAGEEWSNSFDYTAEETGDVEWSVVAGDNEETGTTTFVDEPSDDGSDSGSDSGSDDSGSDSGSDDGDSGSDDSGGDDSDGDDDGTPGFGVAVALAALLGAAMLALRKQN